MFSLIIFQSGIDIIDVGLEGGKAGGEIITHGTPEELIKNKVSHTAKYLKKELI